MSAGSQVETDVAVTPYFFDVLHLDGRDLLDSPGHERNAVLDDLGFTPEELAKLRGQ